MVKQSLSTSACAKHESETEVPNLLSALYDRYAPVIYGSIIKMGVAPLAASEILSATFLQVGKACCENSSLHKPDLLTLILHAWRMAQIHLNNGTMRAQVYTKNDLNRFLEDKGFTQVQISLLLQHSTAS